MNGKETKEILDIFGEYDQVVEDISESIKRGQTSGAMEWFFFKNDYETITEEMEQFLKAHYPIYGAKKTAEAFNKRFNQKRSVHTIKEKSMQLGAYLNEESFAKYREDTTKILIAYNKTNAYEVGAIGRQSNGTYRIKVGEGAWVSIGKYLYEKYIGKVPSGYQVIYLDGNKENREPSNLEMVPVSYQALMNKLCLRSSDREITKTSVKWCELHEVLRKQTN